MIIFLKLLVSLQTEKLDAAKFPHFKYSSTEYQYIGIPEDYFLNM
jgi:predicted Holliday junction resolvase-like endonuclease